MKVRNFHKDDVACMPFKGSAGAGGGGCGGGGQRTFQRGGALRSRRGEKAWEQDLVSIGAPVLNLVEAGDFIRDPIEGVLGA